MTPDSATLTEVAHLYAVYARAIDEKRFDLLARVFAADAALAYTVGPHAFECSGAEAAGYFGRFLELCYWTNHLIGMPMVEADGEGLFATARVIATHLQRRHEGTMSRWTLRGSYHDRLVRTDGAWRIVRRVCLCPDSEGAFLEDGVERFPGVAWADPAELG